MESNLILIIKNKLKMSILFMHFNEYKDYLYYGKYNTFKNYKLHFIYKIH